MPMGLPRNLRLKPVNSHRIPHYRPYLIHYPRLLGFTVHLQPKVKRD